MNYSLSYINKMLRIYQQLQNTASNWTLAYVIIGIVILYCLALYGVKRNRIRHMRVSHLMLLLACTIFTIIFIFSGIIHSVNSVPSVPSCKTYYASFPASKRPITDARMDKNMYLNKHGRVKHNYAMRKYYNQEYIYYAKRAGYSLFKKRKANYWKNRFNIITDRINAEKRLDKHPVQPLPKPRWNNTHFPYSAIGDWF